MLHVRLGVSEQATAKQTRPAPSPPLPCSPSVSRSRMPKYTEYEYDSRSVYMILIDMWSLAIGLQPDPKLESRKVLIQVVAQTFQV